MLLKIKKYIIKRKQNIICFLIRQYYVIYFLFFYLKTITFYFLLI